MLPAENPGHEPATTPGAIGGPNGPVSAVTEKSVRRVRRALAILALMGAVLTVAFIASEDRDLAELAYSPALLVVLVAPAALPLALRRRPTAFRVACYVGAALVLVPGIPLTVYVFGLPLVIASGYLIGAAIAAR